MKLLIKNGRVLNPASGIDRTMDVFIENGVVVRMGEGMPVDGAEVIDAAGMVVAPGFVDIHAHLREPGNERAETVASGAESAMNGGFTAVTAMPNTNPCMDNAAMVSLVRNKAEQAGFARVFPVGAVSKNREGRELAAIGEMVQQGIVAVSDDGSAVGSAEMMKKALEYCLMFDIPVMEHAEDSSLTRGAVMHEGAMSTRLGLKGMPGSAEDIIVARDIILNRQVGGWLHISHLSTAYSLELIRQARDRGERVTTEVTPHHLFFNDEVLAAFNTHHIMKPPLRSETDRLAMIEGVKDGTIDCIATDHAPHPHEHKNCEIDLCAFGIIGFESAVPVSLEILHHRHQVSLKRMVELMAVRPGVIIGLPEDRLKEGAPADITIFSPDRQVTVDVTRFRSRSRNCPFDGMAFRGRPEYTIMGTRVVRCDIGD